jgi:hypothetical protein
VTQRAGLRHETEYNTLPMMQAYKYLCIDEVEINYCNFFWQLADNIAGKRNDTREANSV